MDKKTRVKNAMDRLPVDHVPASFWFHFQGEEESGQANIDAHLNYYRESNIDFLKMMSDGFFNYPFDQKINTASDWSKIRPLGKTHPYIQNQVFRAKMINEGIHGDCCTFYNAFAPFSTIRHAASNDLVMAHLSENPQAVTSALDAIAEDTCELIRLLIEEAGCEGVFIPLQGGEVDRFTPEEYEKLISPSENKLFQVANQLSDYNIVHLCAWDGVKNQLQLWRDIPCKTVNWAVHIEELSLEEGIQYFSPKSVMGGFDNRNNSLLMTGTEEEIKNYTKKIIETTGETGVILAADCSLPSGIDINRIKWVTEAL